MKAVIFDMDGVLIDSEPLHYATDLALLGELGLSVPRGYLDGFVGMTNPAMWERILSEFQRYDSVGDILVRQLALKLAMLESGPYAPIEGIPGLLARLRERGIPLAVASSSSGAFIGAALRKLGIAEYFQACVSGEDVARGKPEPDVFLRAAETLGAAPADCVVIEDSRHGVAAARRAGMRCVGFVNPRSGNQDLSAAHVTVADFAALTDETLFGLG